MEIRPIVSSLLRNKTGALLIAAQVALTFAIVVNAAYVIRDRLATAARPSGVDDEERVLSLRFTMNSNQNLDALQQRDLASLRAVPGVESASISNQVPLGTSGWNGGVTALNRRDSPNINGGFYFDGGDMLPTLGIEVVEGRYFRPEEIMVVDPQTSRDNPPIALITRQFAQKLFPDQKSVVGRMIYLGGGMPDAPAVRIIGVVDYLQTPWAGVGEGHLFNLVFPQRLLQPYNSYLIRLAADAPARTRQALLDALSKNDSARVSRDGLRSIAKLRERRYRGEKAVAALLLTVTGLLLVVTGSGIVGMASLWVNLRRKQIGVRRALGATRRDIVRYFITENLLITTVGVIAGVIAAQLLNAALMRAISLPKLPWQGLVLGSLVLLALGVAAVLGPALRASRLSPALATRSV